MINRHCNCGCDESDCFIILECGDYILQESGCKILKEIQ
jgi:hypothetical protein